MTKKILMNLLVPTTYRIFRFGLVVTIAASLMMTSVRAYIVCSASTSSTVTLNWTAPSDNGGGVTIKYDIRFAAFQITEQNWNLTTMVEGIPDPHPAGSQETMVVSDLAPSTNYYFAIKTADESYNWSTLSSVVCRRTLSSNNSTPPSTITDLSIFNSTPTEIVLHWTAPANSNGGKVVGYLLQYSKDSITTKTLGKTMMVEGIPQPKSPGSPEQMVVSGLDGESNYQFVIRSRNADFVWSNLSNIAGGITDSTFSGDIHAYPNPFRPSETQLLTFTSIPNRSNLVILTVSGDLVRRWVDHPGGDISWDGTNQSGNAVSSGVYLWYVEGTSINGKIIVIR